MMKIRVLVSLCLIWLMTSGLAIADDVQWVRVTVLLERGNGPHQKTAESLIRGGIYSLAEVERRGQEEIDREILARVRFLAGEIFDLQKSMRLGDLLQRQYYLPLKIGQQATLPVIDLNPRLGIVLEPQRFVGDRLVCKVRFLEPEGPGGAGEYSGEPITLTLKEAKLTDVIRTFSAISKREILYDNDLSGLVTMDLRNIPWDQAFDVILRTNSLGWRVEGDAIHVQPLDDLSRRKRVRTEATINLPRGEDGSATIASRGDEENRTVVLVIESVRGEPDLVAERDGLLHPPVFGVVARDIPRDAPMSDVVVFRGTTSPDGDLADVEVLAAPLGKTTETFSQLLHGSGPWTVLDEQVRKVSAMVGYGFQLRKGASDETEPTLASLSGGLRIEVEVGPMPPEYGGGDPNRYVISAYVKRVEDDEIISAPRITGLRGQSARIRSTIPDLDGQENLLEMVIFVSEDGKRVSYAWTLTREGEVMESHLAKFEL